MSLLFTIEEFENTKNDLKVDFVDLNLKFHNFDDQIDNLKSKIKIRNEEIKVEITKQNTKKQTERKPKKEEEITKNSKFFLNYLFLDGKKPVFQNKHFNIKTVEKTAKKTDEDKKCSIENLTDWLDDIL